MPTEAQWEYAARGGFQSNRFPWGDTISHSQANYNSAGGYSYDFGGPPWGGDPTWSADGISPYTSPVGSYPANGYGLYDMAGNVWQWCNDWYSATYYSSSPVNNPSSPMNNPTGPISGPFPVLRGGGCADISDSCRVAVRYPTYAASPNYRETIVGFRVSQNLN